MKLNDQIMPKKMMQSEILSSTTHDSIEENNDYETDTT